MDLSPGVSVSGADLYAGLCIEGCLSFWRKFGAGGRWSPSVYSLYRELSEQLGKGTGWTWSAHAMGYNFYGLFCYYLCSPFSFLILLFMKFMYVNEAVTAVILIKAGLCSVSMAWYSGKNIRAEEVWQFLLAVCTHCLIFYRLLQQCDVAGLYHASSGACISY